MTADQRLDQLEPLVAQTLAVADRHTAQLKQIFGAVNQLLEAGKVQSDDVQFVLRELSEWKQYVSREFQGVNREIQGINQQAQGINQEIGGTRKEIASMIEDTNQGQSTINARLGVVENNISVVGAKVTSVDDKLDLILGLLSGDKE